MKQKLINFLLHKILNLVVQDDVLKVDKGIIYIGKNKLEDIELRALIAEAKALEGFYLWKILNESIKQDAMNRGWNNATSIEELNSAKTIFYTLDLQNSIVKLIRSRENK
jgi:hypothetical protein